VNLPKGATAVGWVLTGMMLACVLALADSRPWMGLAMPTGDVTPALVSHLPFLARLTGLLLTGDADNGVVRLRTEGIVCLARDDDRWQVGWILTPEIAGVL
jgi:phosphohistidine phosphatase SixA